MKVKHYIYSDNRKANLELKAWFAENFETPEAIEASINEDEIVFIGNQGEIVIGYKEVTEPLTIEGHTFNILVNYHVEYTIGDKVFSSKIVDQPWTQKRIVEVGLVHYTTAMTRVSKQPITTQIKSKAKEERELLKALKAKKASAPIVDEIVIREPQKSKKAKKAAGSETQEF